MKKKIICSVLIIMAGAMVPVMADTITIHNLTYIVSEDSATSKTVSWQDQTGRTDYTVEYRKKGDKELYQAYVTEPKRPPVYDPDYVPTYTYGAYMQKLMPQTVYEYRIVNQEGTTEWFSFATTASALNEYTAIILGDSQSSDDYRVWGKTAEAAYKDAPEAKFFVNMGDLTDNGQAWYQWKAWAEYADILTSHMAAAPVLGNHETYSLDWKFSEPYTYKALFAVPYGGPKGQARMAYSFTYGDVHYVSLNTNYEELHERYPDMMEDEAAWLDADLKLAAEAGKRLVVFMHRPPWNSPYDGMLDINGQYFMPIFDKYKVLLVFTAHEHCYERTVPLTEGKPSDRGTVYIASGRSGTESWDGSRRKPTDVVYDKLLDQPMYMILHAEPDRFTVKAVKQDGTVIDTAVIYAGSHIQEARSQ